MEDERKNYKIDKLTYQIDFSAKWEKICGELRQYQDIDKIKLVSYERK